jgi:cyclic beta-1,2-glucan synthetase
MRSRLLHLRTLALASLATLAFARVSLAESDASPIRLSQARQSGVFNMGAGQAVVKTLQEPQNTEGPLRIDYTLPIGTAAGIWSKAFPPGFDSRHLNLVQIDLKGVGPDQGHRVNAKLEIKGSAGSQSIPLDIAPSSAQMEVPIDWAKIGEIQEVVVAIGQTGADPASGSIVLDVRFEPTPWLREFAESIPARFGLVLGLAGLVALSSRLQRRFLGEGQPSGFQAIGLRRDLVQGMGTVAIAVLSLWVFEFGGREGSANLWEVVAASVLAHGIIQWWKTGLTGRFPSPVEAFQDILAVGLLAASSSPLEILQAPGSWGQTLQLSQTSAAVGVFGYLIFVASRLATTGRHPGAIAAGWIVGTPYAMGALILLSSPGMTQSLGGLFLGDLPKARELLGRLIVLFAFNEALAQGLSLATKRKLVGSIGAHLALLAVAFLAVTAPNIADSGSGAEAASWGKWGRLVIAVCTTMFSQAGLWGEVYLVTGLLMDAIHGGNPTRKSTFDNPFLGIKKGMVYSGTFMAILYGVGALSEVEPIRRLFEKIPLLALIALGTLAFPLVKTIFETFDGSERFFQRVLRSYRNQWLYARGAVVGLGIGYALVNNLAGQPISVRVWFGFAIGLASYAGINFLADLSETSTGQARVQSWKVYTVQGLLGGFIGSAIAFYFDRVQVTLVMGHFYQYLGVGTEAHGYGVLPFLSRWGHIDLGTQTGGVKILFDQALAGVIQWSIPAWLFAINRTFMAAFFQKETAPIKALFTKGGMINLTQTMIEVLRWGLWMSPIIESFLRPMGEPTWYNQDGAIRTVVATYHDVTMTPDAFRVWSLDLFTTLLAFDSVRILIWLDHFGLRVATLVNLSFLGMDRLDARIARFVAPAATARFIPEGVKRFTTWAPLVIPFYLPQGKNWDEAWSRHETIQKAHGGGGLLVPIESLTTGQQVLGVVVAAVICTLLFRWIRGWMSRHDEGPASWLIANTEYQVTLTSTGEVRSETRGFDVTRRSYDSLDPAGRALFLVDGSDQTAWPVVGNFPRLAGEKPRLERVDDCLRISSETHGLKTTVEIRLTGEADPAEVWEITVENASDAARSVKLVPYLEWVLNKPDADRGHTQYNRLFAEMEYAQGLHAVLAWDKHAKAMGVLAADIQPEGFLTARVDFIGRARSLWDARALETLAFSGHQDTDAHPTFDPIGALFLPLTIPAKASTHVRILIGLVNDKKAAIDLIARTLKIPGAESHPSERRRKIVHSIRHGEIPPGTPQPYHEFVDEGRTLRVLTPFTPRPYDHAMSNALGQTVMVTNRGLHTSASGNSQQNRITPDWPDTVTREVPSEAFYLYDIDTNEWFSPTYHPINDNEASYLSEFSVDGTATFRMIKGPIETELTVFVPPDDPTTVYLLTIRNHSTETRRFRVAPYFQIVLAAQPEFSGPLEIRRDPSLHAIFFTNPRNTFRQGPAFAAISKTPERIETARGEFFGQARDVAHPSFVERGEPKPVHSDDDRPVAAFLTTIEVHPLGEATVVTLLGQADDRDQAEAVIRKYQDVKTARLTLEETRAWWLSLMDTVRVETASARFDGYLDWLKYQALAERIWARRGFYQASGAFGFRDQLQDSVNLIWMDPALARKQILLHGSQQFLEGDVVHWFHRFQDGRTGFVARTHASDNLLWLAWGVVEYLGATGDETLLDESTPYLESELPFPPLPANQQGIGFDPLRSSREDTIYRHALKAIDRVLDRKMGAHGLPLIGTGDWNDGLDEIGSQGRGESIWLGFFLYYILERMAPIVGRKDGDERQDHYLGKLRELGEALESTWRDDRYLRAIHDDGTEIGIKGSGVWEIDALTAAWAVMAGINPGRGRIVFETALSILEKETTILLGWPSLSEDTKPYLGRSSAYPEGVRENGMYCHGVQWLVGAARLLSNQAASEGRLDDARHYREDAYRLWRKVSPLPHVEPDQIETYGGQPNKQAADMVTTFDPGRMIWHGYTGAAGWMFRQAIEGVLGYRLVDGKVERPQDPEATPAELGEAHLSRHVEDSPLPRPISTSNGEEYELDGDRSVSIKHGSGDQERR